MIEMPLSLDADLPPDVGLTACLERVDNGVGSGGESVLILSKWGRG